MVNIPFPRGVRDLMPNEAIFKKSVLDKIERVYQRFGFSIIDTPKIESLDILKAKDTIGEDNKLIFEIPKENLGLRYDFTVSLGRYIATHQNLPIPFKRYAIGEVWRMDEPQRLRYREFTQADIDVIGGDRSQNNAEVFATLAKALDELGVEYIIMLNSREIMNAVLNKLGILSEKKTIVLRIIDKLDKQGSDGVSELLQEQISSELADSVLSFINFDGENNRKLEYVEELLEDTQQTDELKNTLKLLERYEIKGKIKVDFSIVRGINYYTGIVVEFKYLIEDKGQQAYELDTIAGGGRYGNLVRTLGGKEIEGVGISCGIDRILDILHFSSSEQKTYSNVFVAIVKKENYTYALDIANNLRKKEIAVDINTASRNISNQLSYAGALNYRFVVIIGEMEEKMHKIKLRDMENGKEKLLNVDDAAEIIVEISR